MTEERTELGEHEIPFTLEREAATEAFKKITGIEETFTYVDNGRTLQGSYIAYPPELRGMMMQSRRRELGLTLEEVADRIGVNKSTIQRYESGKIKHASNEVLEKLGQLYGINLQYMVLDHPGVLDGPTQQHTDIAIVREYPANLEQQQREDGDCVAHFHFDVTVKPALLQRHPDIEYTIKELVMALEGLSKADCNILLDLAHKLRVQSDVRAFEKEEAEIMAACNVWKFLAAQQGEISSTPSQEQILEVLGKKRANGVDL